MFNQYDVSLATIKVLLGELDPAAMYETIDLLNQVITAVHRSIYITQIMRAAAQSMDGRLSAEHLVSYGQLMEQIGQFKIMAMVYAGILMQMGAGTEMEGTVNSLYEQVLDLSNR